MWVAPVYRQSKIAYRLIKGALAASGDAGRIVAHSSDSELVIELVNGARLLFSSTDNYEALRGIGIHFLVIDECATVNAKAWTEVLRPTLSDTQGKALFLGTPKGRNFFYVLFQRGLDPGYPEWESFTAPTSANPYIPADEIVAARSELPEPVFLQEYEAVFLEESAGVFTGIDACIAGEFRDPDPQCSYIIGWDIAKHQDYSVMTVLNCNTMHVDYWERSNKIDYTVQLERLYYLAEKYHAFVLLDMTGVGDPILDQVQRRGIPCDGYLFTNASKKVLIETLVVGIQNRALSFPDLPILIGELRMMEYTLSPSRLVVYAAPQGAHDDCVMSLALAFFAAIRPHVPLSGDDVSVPEAPPTLQEVVVQAQATDPFEWAARYNLWGDE